MDSNNNSFWLIRSSLVAFALVAGACGVDERDLSSTPAENGDANEDRTVVPDAQRSPDASADASTEGRTAPDAAVTADAAVTPDSPLTPDSPSALPDVAAPSADVAPSDAVRAEATVDAARDASPPIDSSAPGDARIIPDASGADADAQSPSPAMLSLTGTSAFGNVALGSSQDETFVVHNAGQQTGALNVVVSGAAYSRVASASADCGATLAGGVSCNITVRCTPTALGPTGGALSASTAIPSVTLSATGVCPGTQANCSGVCIDLTNDPGNCGRCGHGCLTTGTCSAGKCQPIPFVAAALTSNIVDLASDGNVVVWADSGNNTVNQVGSPGAAKIVLGASPTVSQPLNVAIDASSGTVFWAQQDGTIGFAARGSANSAAMTGCSGGNTIAAINVPAATAVDILSPGFLSSCSMSQGVANSGLVVADTGFNSTQVGKVLTPHWFVGDVTNQQVLQLGPMGFPTQDIRATIPLQTGVLYLAEDASFVYWSAATGSGPAILRAPSASASATTMQTILTNAGGTVGGLATDGVNVYYQNGSGIFYIPVAGATTGTPLTALNGLFLKYAAGALYFASGGGIFKIATP